MCDDFDRDMTNPNPYVEPRACKSNMVYFIWLRSILQADVALAKLKSVLAAEEVVQFNDGQKPPHEVTPSGFLRMAINIKEQQ